MKKFYQTTRRLFLTLLIVCSASFAWAQDLSGSGTKEEPYLIQDEVDWETFASNVNSGTSYSGQYIKLENNITVSEMVGQSDHSFSGTFMGDGHTLTFYLTTTENFCAPFRYVSGATISSLKTKGTIETSAMYASGLVGYARDSKVTIVNCLSSMTITCSEDDSRCGGFVASTNTDLTIRNCRFDGYIYVSNGSDNGGFVGIVNYNSIYDGILLVSNCLFAPSELAQGSNLSRPNYTFVNGSYNALRDCYYTQTFGEAQGIPVGVMTNSELLAALGSGWQIVSDKVIPIMDIKNLATGSIECESFFLYTGSDITVTPTVKDMVGDVVSSQNYTVAFSNTVHDSGEYTVTVTGVSANGYTGSTTRSFTVAAQLTGAGTQQNPYTISSVSDWNQFANLVNCGCDYQGQFVQLATNNLTITQMVGVYDEFDDRPFRGTFDGNNLTLNVNISSVATGSVMNENGVAPFHHIQGASIYDLTITGTITSNSPYAGGLVGLVSSGPSPLNTSNITNCDVKAIMNVAGDYPGGIIGNTRSRSTNNQSIYLNGCVFAGTINNTSSYTYATVGGMYGYGRTYVDLTNCLENGTYDNFRTVNPRCGMNDYQNQHVTSFYYVNAVHVIPDNYIQEGFLCYKVETTAPTDNVYLARTFKGNNTVYQKAKLSGMKPYYAYTGSAIALGYTMGMGTVTMVENTDYTTTIKNSSNETVAPENLIAKGSYTIHFTAMPSNTTGYAGESTYSFQILEGETLDGGYVFLTEGEGENKVYLITNEADLERLAEYVNSDRSDYNAPYHNALGMTFKLTSNITMEGGHTTIAKNYDYVFRGTFDGNHCTISNLTINEPNSSYRGLFGYVGASAVIKDLTLTDCSITGYQYVGGIAGCVSASGDPSTIQNCHVNGSISATGNNAMYHGGIVGSCSNTTIENCTMKGSISTAQSSSCYGGIAGRAMNSSSITNCENAASITGPGNSHGGIVGSWEYNNTSASHCFNLGNVEGSQYVGNIVGYPGANNQLSECYYSSPNNIKGTGQQNGSGQDVSGRAERAYTISKGSHITSFATDPAASHHCVLNDTNYYKAGTWTLTFVLEEGYNFLNYVCEGGTMTNLTSTEDEHVLTITDQDVSVYANMYSTSAVDINLATITIPDQRWRGNVTLKPAITVVDGSYTLEEGVDYYAKWGTNSSVGTNAGEVKLIGINNYMDSIVANFNIVDFTLETPGQANSKNNPYLVETEEDLEILASIVNTGGRANGWYKQNADIICTKEHTPIGLYKSNSNFRFKGDYDGNNKRIIGLTVNQELTDYSTGIGLFGCATYSYLESQYTKIHHVNIVDCNIRGPRYVGGILGYLAGAYVEYCTVTGYVGASEVTDNNSKGFGGIVGYEDYSKHISNCFNAAVVEGPRYVGSILGRKSNDNGLTKNYHAVGTTGGVGSDNSTTGTDLAGAEIAVRISAGPNITIAYPSEPDYIWDSHDLYKSGISVGLSYYVPTGKYFEKYTVSSGTISDPGIETGSHVLSGFTDDVTINGSYVDSQTDLSTATITIIESFTYDADSHYPANPVITVNDVTLEEGVHYTLSYSENSDGTNPSATGFVNAGTYYVIATGIGSCLGTAHAQFTISPFDISAGNAVQISGIYSEYGKTGSPVTPTPTVKCSAINNMTLAGGTDYTLSYSGACVDPGDYDITITGTNNFTGEKVISFTILDMYNLTVHDGTYAEQVPVYGGNCDNYVKTEFLMKQTELSGMAGRVIKKMSFYLNQKASSVWNGTFMVFLKEYDGNNLNYDNGFSGIENATIVYEGSLNGTQDIMTVNFSTPFYYSGEKNLLIGFYKTTKNNWSTAYFWGDNTSSACLRSFNSSSLEDVTSQSPSSQVNFLPKTTFWYQESPDYLLSVTGYGESTESNHWVFISSPVTENLDPTAIANLVSTANYDLYRLNPSTTVWENYKKEHTEAFVIENGKGYLYANKNDVTLAFIGTLNTATSQEVGLDEGWNLVGNPLNGPAYVNKPFYKLNEASEEQAAGSIIVPVVENFDNYVATTIPACTGIIVQAANSDEKVTFSTDAPDVATGNSGNLDITLKQANTRGNAMLDKAIVSFNESKLGKFYFGKQDANIYFPQDNEEYAIVSAQGQGEMPLNFKANKNGEFTLSVNPEGVDMDYLHLIDNMTGADIDLLATPSYSFNAVTTDYASRFKLVFNANDNDNDNENFAFINNGEIIVSGEGTLEIIDALGRIILTREVTPHSSLPTPNSSLAPGVYVLRLINGENVKTQKIVIR